MHFNKSIHISLNYIWISFSLCAILSWYRYIDIDFTLDCNRFWFNFGGILKTCLILGCEEAKSTITAAAPGQPPTIASARQMDLAFQINFTIVNVNFTDQLQILKSSEYINLTTNIIARVMISAYINCWTLKYLKVDD